MLASSTSLRTPPLRGFETLRARGQSTLFVLLGKPRHPKRENTQMPLSPPLHYLFLPMVVVVVSERKMYFALRYRWVLLLLLKCFSSCAGLDVVFASAAMGPIKVNASAWTVLLVLCATLSLLCVFRQDNIGGRHRQDAW